MTGARRAVGTVISGMGTRTEVSRAPIPEEEEGGKILYQPRGEEAPGLRKKEGVGEANSLLAASVDAEGGGTVFLRGSTLSFYSHKYMNIFLTLG